MLDRHYLFDIESQVGIAKLIIVDKESDRPLQDYTNDYVRLILMRDYNLELNFRELPVALLRLHFTGHDRFMTWLRRIPHKDLRHLAQLAYQDTRFTGDPLNDEYHTVLNQVKEYLKLLIDMCYCSFERTLYHFLRESPDKWPSFGIDEAFKNDSYWKNFPYERGISSSFIWYVTLWRIHTARTIERYLKPWRTTDIAQKEWFVYKNRLFCHTHLDLLTAMIYRKVYDDTLLVSSRLLYEMYPNCHRVICAEELPCLVGYTFDNFKTGANLKERCSLEARIGHIVTNKPMPNICKVRNVHKIIRRYGNSDKVIFDLIRLIMYCVLLGNVPNATNSLNLIACVRFTYSMSDRVAYTVVPKDQGIETDEQSRKKKAKKKKKAGGRSPGGAHAKKTDNDEDDDDEDDDFGGDNDEEKKEDTLFTKTLYKARHFIIFTLKIFLFYTSESSGCFDQVLNRNNKWAQHKEIVRAGMAKCRDDISWQCMNITHDKPIDWTRIEFIYKKDDYDIKTGIVMKVHTPLLKTTVKVKKDSFENIIMKKMTSIEEEISFGGENGGHPFVSFMDTENHYITLNEIHMIAYDMAISNREVMQTKWFQVVGMSPRGLSRLRDWIFCYYVYDKPDNAFKKSIIAFQTDSMSDYIILKTMIKLIIYYRHDHIYHLPSSYAVRQTMALRRLLCLDPLQPTPQLLGVHYMCPGCLKFANPVINPNDYDTPIQEKDTLIINHKKEEEEEEEEVKPVEEEKNKTDSEGSEDDEEEEEEDSPPIVNDKAIHRTNKKNRRGRSRRTKSNVTKMYDNDEIKTTTIVGESSTTITSSIQRDQTQQQHQYNVPYFNIALYDINTGHLHCQRDYKKKKSVSTQHANDHNHVIIKGKKNGLIIESNIDPSNHTDVEMVNPTNGDTEEEEEDDEEEDDDIVTFNHEDELFFMNDDSMMDSQWDIANRLTLTTAKMGYHDQEIPTTTPTTTTATKKTNNNKGIISRIVDSAINQKYTCGSPLIPVDMIGVIVNGKALCCDCGCMTEVTNSNHHSHGITCMRHPTPSHHMDHPVWQLDRFTTKQLSKHTHLVRPNDATSAFKERVASRVSSNIKRAKPRQTEHYHQGDLVHQPCGATEYDLIKCHFCKTLKAILYVTAIDRSSLKMIKKEICYSCKHLCKNLTDSCNLRFLDDIERHVFIRNSQYSL